MWKTWWETSGGRIVGVAFGLLLVIIYLCSGFWDMLFCALVIAVSYWVGKHRDDGRGPLLPWDRLADWLTDRWPWSR